MSKKIKRSEEITVGLPLGPIKSVFSQKEEQELAEYVKHKEERLFGLTTLDLRRLAYQLAVRNNKKHNFNNEKEIAGVDRLNGFLKRHPELSIRKPEATSAARAMGFNRVTVGNFYQLLGETYDALHLTPDKIHNCDETGISVVSKTKSKIIALKGRKQVGSLSSTEGGQTVTVEFVSMPDRAPPGVTSACNPNGWMTAEIFTIWFKQFVQFSRASPSNNVLLLLDGHVSHTQTLDVIDLARQRGIVIICFPPHCTHKLQPADVAFMRSLSTYYDHAASNWLRSHPERVITMFQISEIFGQAYMQAATMSTAVNSFRKCGIWPYNQDNFSDVDFIAAETTNIPLAQDNPSTSRINHVKRCQRSVDGDRASYRTESPSMLNSANLPSTASVPHPDHKVPTTSSVVNAQFMETEPHTGPEIPSPSSSANLPSTESAPLTGSNNKRGPKSGRNTLETEQVQSIHEDLFAPVLFENQRTPVQLSNAGSPQQDCSQLFEVQAGSSLEIRSPIRAVCRDLTSSFENASPKDILQIPALQMNKKRKNYRRGKTAVITSTPYKKELEALKLSKNVPAKSSKSSKDVPAKNSKSSKNVTAKNSKLQKKIRPSTSGQEDSVCFFFKGILEN
ncbi:hypothetical protein ILUMI_03410 [Ignelater luminosus]|uniref:DDE-1 domain-containing protein n=1 Tax=Ignelater luminosus TaxID=2038154 RepID=A0A8K0DGL6_IGNLU|nr:hypothetical protein ILUMI_03410 [Ignelater luminosus]